MPQEPELEHPTQQNARSPEQTWRILFVDCAANIDKLKSAGRDAGYVVIGATTLEEAWLFLEGNDHADVIVCAAHLEEGSMIGFLKGVRDSAVHGKTIFLILSLAQSAAGNRLERSTRSAGLALGADGYLVMASFDPVDLIARIKVLQPEKPALLIDRSGDADKQKAKESRREEGEP